MYAMNEAMARAHMDARHDEARRQSHAARMARARRAQRRADHAQHRARRAAAQAS